MAAQERAGPLLDRPGEHRLRKVLAQGAGDRHGLDHVADGAEADDEDAWRGHGRHGCDIMVSLVV